MGWDGMGRARARAKRRRAQLPSYDVSEVELQRAVLDLAALHGWKAYHTWNSQHSVPGFPDLILLRGQRMIAAELKTWKGSVTNEQAAWLQAFHEVRQVDAMVIRPAASYDALEEELR